MQSEWSQPAFQKDEPFSDSCLATPVQDKTRQDRQKIMKRKDYHKQDKQDSHKIILPADKRREEKKRDREEKRRVD